MGCKSPFLDEQINYLHLQSKNHTRTRGLMDIASDYGSEGWGFDSLRVHITIRQLQRVTACFIF